MIYNIAKIISKICNYIAIRCDFYVEVKDWEKAHEWYADHVFEEE
tara:strand:+ start:5351 stop:5485 length:135 start_codon:yes stop_codon:yes gene_type:complete